jgi:hypothetical protein
MPFLGSLLVGLMKRFPTKPLCWPSLSERIEEKVSFMEKRQKTQLALYWEAEPFLIYYYKKAILGV